MRQFQSYVKKQFSLQTYNGFPNFPPKKVFGNTSGTFLNNRMTQLQTFFNNFLSNKDIAKSNLLLIYFKEKAAEEQSKSKVEELIDYMEKKVNRSLQS